jgi:hypothetical protein
MEMYRLLGVHEVVLSFWYTVHESWKWKGGKAKGEREWMRLTGQATTALGNVITNMQVHAQFVLTNYDRISLMIFLGDDMLMFMNK